MIRAVIFGALATFSVMASVCNRASAACVGGQVCPGVTRATGYHTGTEPNYCSVTRGCQVFNPFVPCETPITTSGYTQIVGNQARVVMTDGDAGNIYSGVGGTAACLDLRQPVAELLYVSAESTNGQTATATCPAGTVITSVSCTAFDW